MTKAAYLERAIVAQALPVEQVYNNYSHKQESITPRVSNIASQHINESLEERFNDLQNRVQSHYASVDRRLTRLEREERPIAEEIGLLARIIAMFRMYIEAFIRRVSEFFNQ